VGPVNPMTRQPIKGRRFGGGIRFGEMERDALLAHGAAYMLHDRLHTCSDYTVMDVCAACGSLLSPANVAAPASQAQAMRPGMPTLDHAGVRAAAGPLRPATPPVFCSPLPCLRDLSSDPPGTARLPSMLGWLPWMSLQQGLALAVLGAS
jgi:RNA polymerase Rpb2, domain 7